MKKSLFLVAMTFFVLNVHAQTLKLARTVFLPGEQIEIAFTAPASYASNAWVGIIPSSVSHGSEAENDKHDISYLYLSKKTSGVLKFTAPKQTGKFDFRMHDTDNNGKEVATVSFEVSNQITTPAVKESNVDKPVLWLATLRFAPGQEIKLYYKTPSWLKANAWIGIIPANIPHGSEAENDKHDLKYQYVKSSAAGELTFNAPTNPGNYSFRMHDTDSDGKEILNIGFTVK